MHATDPAPLTGRKVLAITLTAFGVILAANMALLWAALGSFPGLEVRNSYVASQKFDAARTAQRALGWQVQAMIEPGVVLLELNGRDGAPVRPETLHVTIGRPAFDAADRALALSPTQTGYRAVADLDPGAWQLRIDATSRDGTLFHQRLALIAPEAR